MAEEELSPAQQLAIAKNFVLNSPPGQATNVLDDVRQLIGKSVLTEDKELALMAQVNKEKFAAVKLPDGKSVLLTPHGELPNGEFFDPSTGSKLVVQHKELKAAETGSHKDAQNGASVLREAVDAAMTKYCKERMLDAVVTTYGTSGAGTKIVCCVAALKCDLGNYYAGRWNGEWTLEVPSGASRGKLTGKISCNIHYFEDGNVQLHDSTKFESKIALQDCGSSFVGAASQFEAGFNSTMEDIYRTMSQDVLNSLRRRLPITKVKFDWDNKASVHKLAQDLNKMKS